MFYDGQRYSKTQEIRILGRRAAEGGKAVRWVGWGNGRRIEAGRKGRGMLARCFLT